MITRSEKFGKYIVPEHSLVAPMEQTVYKFENNYGASVIHGFGSYGLEVAVLWDPGDGNFLITYNTPLTDDVIGYVEDLDSVLEQIKSLEG